MNLILQATAENFIAYRNAFARLLPELKVYRLKEKDEKDGDDYDPALLYQFAGVWDPAPGQLATIPGLQVIFTLSAGVDNVLRDRHCPDVPIVRLLDAGMGVQMAQYMAYGVLHFSRRFDTAKHQQRQAIWDPAPMHHTSSSVGILGCGTLGRQVAQALLTLGYQVSGWCRSPWQMPDVTAYNGMDQLPTFLANSQVLINLLPATTATQSFLNAERLQLLPDDAALINAGRGSTLDINACTAALDSGKLRGALLDVFSSEPLSPDSPLWTHPKVLITPHIAARTLIDETAQSIAKNIQRFQGGESMPGTVRHVLGY